MLVLSKDYGIKFNVPSAFCSFQIYSVSFCQACHPSFKAHHNLNLMVMESTDQKTLFEVAEIQLSYKSKVKASLRPKITSSRDCDNVLRKYWDENKIEFVEQFKVLLLNRANKVIGLYEVSTGTTTHTVADPRLIFVAAIKANACAIILSHNHPSGNLKPSQADMDLTKKLKEAGKFLEVSVLDHIIITSEAYYSFADEGLL
jgi:DNA repair protein RadC